VVIVLVCGIALLTAGAVLVAVDRPARPSERSGTASPGATHDGVSRLTGPSTAASPYATNTSLADSTNDPGPDPVFVNDPDLRRTDTYTYRFTKPGDHQLAAGTYAFQYDATTGSLKARLAEHRAQLAAATGLALYLTGGTALTDTDLAALQSVHRDLGVANLVRLYVYNLRTIQGGVECVPASGLACAGQTARGGLFPYLWYNGWWGTSFRYLILDDLTTVPDGAFSNHNFSEVSLRAARSIGVMAFGHAPHAQWSLLYLPSVETIAHDAFRRNQGLTKVNLPRVRTIDDYAFDDATSLRYMNAPELVRFGRNALNDSGQLRSVNFPKVEYLGINSLNGLLTGLRLPALTTVDKSAIRGFPDLRWIYAPRLTTAWDDAFTNNPKLEYIYLPAATDLRVRALAGNPILDRVILGERPPRQGADVFAGSSSAVIYHSGGDLAWAGFTPAGNASRPVRTLP
jgi:hypothetical protein